MPPNNNRRNNRTRRNASTQKWNAILPPLMSETIRAYLRADVPTFDVGGYVVGDDPKTATLYCKTEGSVLAAVPYFNAVFDELGCKVKWYVDEGQVIPRRSTSGSFKEPTATVTGPGRLILLGERIALNILSRASGIATNARKLSTMAKDAGWAGEVAGSRKLTPGFREIEKYALLVGGASTHRMDLSHMVMLKDNHIWATGNITNAVKAARKACGFSSKIEVEVDSAEKAIEAGNAGADIVMLDNFDVVDEATKQRLFEAAAQIKAAHPKLTIEASGGISEKTLLNYLSPNVDVVSLGSLTHGYGVCDFSLKIDH